MDNKFRNEVDKIENLLDKVEQELNGLTGDLEPTAFFKNVDKSVEVYNLCLEELCGQLQLLELPGHSRALHKLCFSYKHQLYNVIRCQLSLQKEIAFRIKIEKGQSEYISQLSNELQMVLEKASSMEKTIEDQKARIERLMKHRATSRSDLNLEREETFLRASIYKDQTKSDIDQLDLAQAMLKTDGVPEIYLKSQEKDTLLPVE